MAEMKIEQDPRILQQILGRMPEAGNQVNIIYVNQIGTGDKPDLLKIIDELPPPRLKHLEEMITAEALRICGTAEAAAGYLGITVRSMRNLITTNLKLLEKEGKQCHTTPSKEQ